MAKKLTPKQEVFVREYLIDLNASAACLRAGFNKKNPDNANKMGSDLMSRPHVAAAIQKGMNLRAKRLEIKQDDILRELMRVAMVDLSGAYDDNGELLPIKQIPEDLRRAVSGTKVYEEFIGSGNDRVKIGETVELKLWDKLRALELLGKHLRLFGNEGVVINNFDKLSDDEIDRRIKELTGEKK